MAQSNYIQSVLDAAREDGGADGSKSINWFREKIKEFGKPGALDLIRDGRRTNGVNFGTLNMFFYSPKHKNTLPYYDTFPLVLPIGQAAGGFMGLNIHYLPIQMRIRLARGTNCCSTSSSAKIPKSLRHTSLCRYSRKILGYKNGNINRFLYRRPRIRCIE